jgi:hypothetical protein
MQDDPRISLDGAWDFQVNSGDLNAISSSQEWREAVVPMPWQAQFDDLRITSGIGWYRRHFAVDAHLLETAAENAAILHFSAVNYHATVWLNGEIAGEHEGGYLPFEFDVISLLRKGDNQLMVRAVDPTDDRGSYPDYPFSEVPHGKQSWYGPIGGIWQSVWLEFLPALHIAQLVVNPSPDDKTIGVEVKLSAAASGDYQLACTVTDPGGNTAGSATFDQVLSGEIPLQDDPQLWGLDAPNLYTVTAILHIDGHPTHAAHKTCGFRTVEARTGRIYLNGEPVYLRGVLDQAYYPETIYTPNSLELLEDQARKVKALGFNCLRTHIKIEDPVYYDVADRLGLLVWTEIPNWILLTDAADIRIKQSFTGMVERDGHHPSIIAWTLVNENWGTDLTRNPEHRRWLADFYHEAKAIDPTRLIVDNSACCDNAHVAGDVEDFHHYRAIPDHAADWDEWVADFAGRSDWAWYSDYEQERRDDLPLLVSEFGNWGLPDPRDIQEAGAEPWWFEMGIQWGDGIVYPHGVLQRFRTCGLGDLFPSYAEFARQSQEHMARSLHYEISSMRLFDAVAGYVVTEFTDVQWECNGLLTMQRQTKHMLDPLLRDLNQDRVVLLRPQQWSGRPGEALEILVQTKDVSGQQSSGTIQWQAGGSLGELPAPGGSFSFTLNSPGVVTLHAQWLADDGSPLATNQVDLVCVETPMGSSAQLRVIDNPDLAVVLRELGHAVTEGDVEGDVADDEIVVATHYTRALEAYIQKGGRVLLLADPDGQSDEATVPLPAGFVVPRAGTSWQGDWATSFSWVKKQGPLAHLPGGPLLEMEWAAIMPDVVLAGLPDWAQRNHSWAGLALGWVHKTVSLLSVLPYGRGRILITTFKLNATTLATDAVGQALFAGMLNML